MCASLHSSYAGQTKTDSLSQADCDLIFDALDVSADGELVKSEFVEWLAVGLTKQKQEMELYAQSGPLQAKLATLLLLIRAEIDAQNSSDEGDLQPS